MRLLFTGCLALVLIVAVTPLQAQESWVLYDDFNGTRPLEPFLGKTIDPDKWEPRDSNTLYILDYAREIRSNQLHLLNRTHGLSFADFQVSTIVRLQFPGTIAPLVTAMRATVTVKSFEVTGGFGVLSRVRGGRLSGFFFNTGSGTGGGNSGDILAAIYIEGLSDSPQILRVVAHVEKCSDRDASCNLSEVIFLGDFGTVRIGKPTRLSIQWDEENHQFIFQRDHAQKVYDYTGDVNPSTYPAKRIDVSNRAVGNGGAERPVAAMDVLVDNVFVNANAVLTP